MIRIALLTTLALALAGALGAAVMVFAGIYNVAATTQHTQALYSVLELAMRQSVRLRARDIQTPPLTDPHMIRQGAACYQAKCVQCHGAPGVAQGDIGKSMQPLPGPLVDAQQHWKPRELYWVTRHGIKMSGMPAWAFRLTDEELWSVVAFLQKLPDLTPQAYQEAVREVASREPVDRSDRVVPCGQMAAAAAAPSPSAPSASGDVARGKMALYQYACNACHTIPGITGSFPQVGPPLEGIARRPFIAGKLANTHENMVQWLRNPKEVDPLTAMPDMGVTEAHANDIAAYLATLR